MYEVGYSDVKAFREVFRNITDMSPSEYRGKYNKGGGGGLVCCVELGIMTTSKSLLLQFFRNPL